MLALSFGAAAGTCIGILFCWAAFGKLRHRALLPAVIANYRLLPAPLVRPAATLLPWAELLLGAALLVGGRPAAYAAAPAAVLLLIFAFAMDKNIRRGRSHIDCGCGFGGLRQSLHRALVLRNVLLAAALLPLLLAPGALPVVSLALAAAAGIAACLLLLLLDALLALSASSPFAA
ncbi:MauE/DoxX family redox-associated membrane protein [Sphingomonas bacterium]|uniref:MauE/DoxX family redox-associated membrane protein n=1 Tax=Sphingomonas bacterium TaxID=1895847 RepID=UPI0020C73F26|nr:MauE/DoxX family redox-associated membrane protein [Sphingomonas bacterium]